MKDAGEIFTLVATLAVTVLGIVLKAQEAKRKKLVGESKDGQEPAREEVFPLSEKSPSTSKTSDTFVEGQRMIEDPVTKIPDAVKKPARKKPDIDKKKLIIYSELLKPKFDE